MVAGVAVGAVVVAGACKPMAPPPMVALHDTTAAAPRGESSIAVILGGAAQLLADGGWGLAVRFQHQATDRSNLGVELTGGRGDGRWVLAARGFGRTTPDASEHVAVTYGVGVTALDTGLVAITGQLGGATSDAHAAASLWLGAGVSGSLVARRGGAWGKRPAPGSDAFV